MNENAVRFAHQRLDAYRVALGLFQGVEIVAAAIPRGLADLKDQLRRAAGATVGHIAEGANRICPRSGLIRRERARADSRRPGGNLLDSA